MKPIQAPRKIATLLLYTEGKMTDESSDMKILGHVSQAFHYGYIADPWEKKRKAPVINNRPTTRTRQNAPERSADAILRIEVDRFLEVCWSPACN